jgi:hypothetical protein
MLFAKDWMIWHSRGLSITTLLSEKFMVMFPFNISLWMNTIKTIRMKRSERILFDNSSSIGLLLVTLLIMIFFLGGLQNFLFVFVECSSLERVFKHVGLRLWQLKRTFKLTMICQSAD